jgi:hypothetical protein
MISLGNQVDLFLYLLICINAILNIAAQFGWFPCFGD